MAIIDFVFLGFMIFGAYKGYKDGLLVVILSFLAFIVAIISAFKLLSVGIEYLQNTLHWESVFIPLIAFILVFALVYFSIFLFSKFLKKVIDYTLLGSVDAFAGAVFGILKIAFCLSLLLWLLNSAGIDFPRNITKGSYLLKPLTSFAHTVNHYVSYIIPLQNIFPAIKNLLN